MKRAQKYIRLDDEWQAQKAEKRDEKRFQDGKGILGDKGSGISSDKRGERFQSYTSMTESRSSVLMWI